MLLHYFSPWKNRDSPSGLAVESPCTVPVRTGETQSLGTKLREKQKGEGKTRRNIKLRGTECELEEMGTLEGGKSEKENREAGGTGEDDADSYL